jgi:flavin reductase (DIM6/NTAB) family NADH-FMN oxidoreductase RutF
MGSAVASTWVAEAGPARPAGLASVGDVNAFRNAMGSFPTEVTVVTVASDDGSIYDMTVNSFSSVSLDPMLVLVCLNQTSRGVGLIERAGAFAVNVLSRGTGGPLAVVANRPARLCSTACPSNQVQPAVRSWSTRRRRSTVGWGNLIASAIT